jgi:hypothetical protein
MPLCPPLLVDVSELIDSGKNKKKIYWLPCELRKLTLAVFREWVLLRGS